MSANASFANTSFVSQGNSSGEDPMGSSGVGEEGVSAASPDRLWHGIKMKQLESFRGPRGRHRKSEVVPISAEVDLLQLQHELSTYFDDVDQYEEPWYINVPEWIMSRFFFCRLGFALTLTFLVAPLLMWTETKEKLLFMDAWFTAVSAFTCTGLATVNVSNFSGFAVTVFHLTMTIGGGVLTTLVPPLLRYLHNKWRLKSPLTSSDKRREYTRDIDVHWLMCCVLCGYMFVMQVGGGLIIYWLTSTTIESAFRTSNVAFNNSVFYTSIHAVDSSNSASLIVNSLLVMSGNTMFPVFLRAILVTLKFVTKLIGGTRNKWHQAVNLALNNPIFYHTHLFSTHDTMYIFGMWFVIAGMMFFPLVFTQWNGVLSVVQTPFQKIVVAFAQAVSVRSSGYMFFDFTPLQPFLLMFIIFALYIPGLPLPQLKRKEKRAEIEKFATPIFAFRHFTRTEKSWLFAAAAAICTFEGYYQPAAKDLGLLMVVLLEVMSGFGTSGVTLQPWPGPRISPPSSACTYFSRESQVILMMVMMGGAHRRMYWQLPLDDDMTIMEPPTPSPEISEVDTETQTALDARSQAPLGNSYMLETTALLASSMANGSSLSRKESRASMRSHRADSRARRHSGVRFGSVGGTGMTPSPNPNNPTYVPNVGSIQHVNAVQVNSKESTPLIQSSRKNASFPASLAT